MHQESLPHEEQNPVSPLPTITELQATKSRIENLGAWSGTEAVWFFAKQFDALKNTALSREELSPIEKFYLRWAQDTLAGVKEPLCQEQLRDIIAKYKTTRYVH